MTVVWLSFLCIFTSISYAAGGNDMNGITGVDRPNVNDSIGRELEGIEVIGDNSGGWKKGNTSVWLNTGELATSARVFGETDIIGSIKTLPGVMSAGDYGSGIIIDGAETSQTLFLVDDAPVFFPYRFGGIFSSFNSSFFQTVEFERLFHTSSMPARLGGKVSLRPYYICDGFNGEFNVGLIASSATMRFGKGDRWSIGASGRVSYLNQLYGKLLASEKQVIGYDFSDINIGGSVAIGKNDRVSAGYFRSGDHLLYSGKKYDMDTRIRWKNEVASIGWRHVDTSDKEMDIDMTIYYSGFNSNITLLMPGISILAQAGIRNFGLNGKSQYKFNAPFASKISYGLELNHYRAIPQWCEIYRSNSISGQKAESQLFDSYRVYADYSGEISGNVEFTGGISAGYYHISCYHKFMPDARLNFLWRNRCGEFLFHSGTYHQYLHQTGFSEIGLASDFWSGATKSAPVSKSYNFAVEWTKNFENIAQVEASIYYKIVKDTPEFDGVILDLIESDYDSMERIKVADGYSYGLNLRVSRDFNKVSGSIAYSFGDGFRHFADKDYWRSRTSIGNVLKMSLTYRPDNHWILGATFNYASGRPYTPIKTIYLVAESAMLEYGRYNSERLPSYQRLDLSASYVFRTGGRLPLRHIVNLSLLNAYGHKNAEMLYYAVDKETYKIKRILVSSLYRFLPSISYTIEI